MIIYPIFFYKQETKLFIEINNEKGLVLKDTNSKNIKRKLKAGSMKERKTFQFTQITRKDKSENYLETEHH